MHITSARRYPDCSVLGKYMAHVRSYNKISAFQLNYCRKGRPAISGRYEYLHISDADVRGQAIKRLRRGQSSTKCRILFPQLDHSCLHRTTRDNPIEPG